MVTVSFPKPKILLSIVGLTILVCVIWYRNTHAAQVFYSCTQAEAAGYHDIKISSPLYRKSLDRDNDQVACEL